MPLVTPKRLVAHGQDHLLIDGIRIEAIIGFSPHEQDVLQPLDVDLDIAYEPPAQYQDDPSTILDYKILKDRLRQELRGSRFQLIEAFAEDVARRVLDFHPIDRVAVTVHKPGALSGTNGVAVRSVRSHA